MKVIVVGGGPAGMMAAISAAEKGHGVTLIEQNDKLGKKLFLTGKGRCNLTNSCDTEELFNNIVRNPKFLYSSIYSFDNNAVMDFFVQNGLKLKVERGNRVFPASDHSSDVIKTLKESLKRHDVKTMLNSRVIELITEVEDGCSRVAGVILSGDFRLYCDALILAAGGKSYPSTGSDGSFFEVIRNHGIIVKELSPSLVPLTCSDGYVTELQGLSLKNVSLKMLVEGKKRHEGFGEMLFTHFGVSGPLILSASAKLDNKDLGKKIELHIDLKPALSEDMLDKRILRDFEDNQNKNFENAIGALLPSKIIPSVIKLTGIDPKTKVNSVTHEERHKLLSVIKDFPVTISGNRGFEEAIITRGGVDVKEINPSTLESKKIKGLYFAGEMIDTDAYTGGFNLQIAWSTGHLAGEVS